MKEKFQQPEMDFPLRYVSERELEKIRFWEEILSRPEVPHPTEIKEGR